MNLLLTTVGRLDWAAAQAAFHYPLARLRPGVAALLLVLAALGARPGAAQAPPWQQLSMPTAVHAYGSGTVELQDAVADAAGNLVVVGNFTGQASFGGAMLVSEGSTDIVLACWNPSTSLWMWAVSAGGTGTDVATRLAVSGSNIYFTGSYQNDPGDNQATRIAGQPVPGYAFDGQTNMYVAKYTATSISALGGGCKPAAAPAPMWARPLPPAAAACTWQAPSTAPAATTIRLWWPTRRSRPRAAPATLMYLWPITPTWAARR